MRRAGRQRINGLIVNDHVNVARLERDALKATLHNCAKNGPQAENHSGRPDFRAHLEGRVVWIENVNRWGAAAADIRGDPVEPIRGQNPFVDGDSVISSYRLRGRLV
jgi:hypothetical protein